MRPNNIAKSPPSQCETSSNEWRDSWIGLAQLGEAIICLFPLDRNRLETLGINLKIERQECGKAKWHSQFKCQLFSSRDWVIDFSLTERSFYPTVVFKCLVYSSQNHGWIYCSTQLQFKWHFKTNSWHLNDSMANRFMNTESLFINITWIPFLWHIQNFGNLHSLQRVEETQQTWGKRMSQQSLEGQEVFQHQDTLTCNNSTTMKTPPKV